MELPEFLRQPILGNSWERWVAAFSIFCVVFFTTWILRKFFISRLKKFAHLTASQADDVALDLLQHTRKFFLFLVAIHFAVQSLTLHPKVDRISHMIFTFVVFFQIGSWAMRAITCLGDSWADRTLSVDAGKATTIKAMLFFVRIFVWLTVGLLLLDNWDVKVAPFVAGLGIGGIAIALAVQNILGDLFASLSIVLDKPFVIGDSIGVDKEGGVVEHIGLKTTRVRSNSGEQLIFSNSDLLKSRIRNYRRMDERCVAATLSVPYETAPEKLEKIPALIRQSVESAGDLRFDRAHLSSLGDHAVEFEYVYWVKSPSFAVYREFNQKVALSLIHRFQQDGIRFFHPIFTDLSK